MSPAHDAPDGPDGRDPNNARDGAPGDDGIDFGSRTEFYTFAPEELARALDDYEILREVGKGSMGIVYEAHRRSDGLRVALKVLPPSLTLTERTLARFLREGEITARMDHPSITPVYDQGRRGRLHYFAMEFIDGPTLQQRLELGPLPAHKVAHIGVQAADALHYAHELGVVHRDIKPGNIMLRRPARDAAPGVAHDDRHDYSSDETTGNGIAITDFGLARETGTGSMTESGAIVGTPMYMAPEQVLGETDHLIGADVYALGATLYTALTGQPPFDGPTAQAVLRAVLDKDPVPPRRLRRDLSPDLEAIVLKAMEKEPAHRYATAEELGADLERFCAGERVLARRPHLGQRLFRQAARRPLLTALVAVILVLAAGTFYLGRQSVLRQQRADLAEAEKALALAGARADDRGRVLTVAERRSLLHEAVAAASQVLVDDPDYWPALFVRAKARGRLGEYTEALRDLDRAAEQRGAPDPGILHFRIDTLRMIRGPESWRRLQEDLTTLLSLFPSDYTRCLVAEHMLAMAAELRGGQRDEVLDGVQDVMAAVSPDLARGMAIRARALELHGNHTDALQLMRWAARRDQSDLVIQSAAASMFERLGLYAEEQAARDLVEALELEGPGEAASGTPPNLEARGVGTFLEQVQNLLNSAGGARK